MLTLVFFCLLLAIAVGGKHFSLDSFFVVAVSPHSTLCCIFLSVVLRRRVYRIRKSFKFHPVPQCLSSKSNIHNETQTHIYMYIVYASCSFIFPTSPKGTRRNEKSDLGSFVTIFFLLLPLVYSTEIHFLVMKMRKVRKSALYNLNRPVQNCVWYYCCVKVLRTCSPPAQLVRTHTQVKRSFLHPSNSCHSMLHSGSVAAFSSLVAFRISRQCTLA